MAGFILGRRLRLVAFLCGALLMVGCPRVQLALEPVPVDAGPDAEQDAKVDVPDTTPDTGQPKDAGDPGEDATAPCGDVDEDGVCDVDDNCPDVANGDQADSDDDGVGDACAQSSGCESSVPNGADLRGATVSGVQLDGSGDNVVTVAPGAEVEVDFTWRAAPCFTPGSAQHVVIGFDSADVEPSCAVSESCLTIPCVDGASCPLNGESATTTLQAPTAPGSYYLVTETFQRSSCGGWSSGPPSSASARVGAVCVVVE